MEPHATGSTNEFHLQVRPVSLHQKYLPVNQKSPARKEEQKDLPLHLLLARYLLLVS